MKFVAARRRRQPCRRPLWQSLCDVLRVLRGASYVTSRAQSVGPLHEHIWFTIVWHVFEHGSWLPPNHIAKDSHLKTEGRDTFCEAELALCGRDVGLKYVPVGLLGQGAFGTVKRAVTIHTNRMVAVKQFDQRHDTPAKKDCRRKERGFLQGLNHVSGSCPRPGANLSCSNSHIAAKYPLIYPRLGSGSVRCPHHRVYGH